MNPNSRIRVLISILVFILLAAVLVFLSEGTYDTGDSISHFQMAQHAFSHPKLFLDLWGKPLFTMLSAPFAFFGFKGIEMFNVLCAAGSALIAYQMLRKNKTENAYLILPFLLFNPLYFVCIFSGLTEILFGLCALLILYFFTEKKYVQGAVLLSFLPFVRSEGFLFFPLFACILMYKNKFLVLPLLLIGIIFIGIAEWISYGDPLHLLHAHPYLGAAPVYGHGAWNFFLRKNEFIWGIPLLILFITGLIYMGLKIKNHAKEISVEILSLIMFLTYFTAHTVFWWKGLFASAGLIRVMAGVMPLSAIVSVYGMNALLNFFGEKIILKRIFISLICLLVCWMPFKQHTFPRPLDYEQKQIKNAAAWLKDEGYGQRKMYYLYPYFSFVFPLDPFDETQGVQLWSVHADRLEKEITPGSIVLWDSHFSPQEGKIPLKNLSENPHFKLLKQFRSKQEELFFEVFVFERSGELLN